MNHLSRISYIENLNDSIKERLKDIYEGIFILTIDGDKEVEERLGRELSDIACRVVNEKMESKDKILVCTKLLQIMNRGSDNIIPKIKAFFEIASALDDQILCWLENIQMGNLAENNHISSLLTQIIISSRIKRGEIEQAEREIEEFPEGYLGLKELSTYYLFMGEYMRSLYFINRALKSSPLHLKEYFKRKRREVIFRMEE